MLLASEEDKAKLRAEIEHKLLLGVVSRSATLCYIWAFVGFIYGFASYELLKTAMPELTLYQNLWPRLIFNSLPAFLLGLWYSNREVHTKLKAYLIGIVAPSMLAGAAMVHAWPLFWNGHADLYLYFHAANIVGISTAFAVVAGTPKVVAAQVLGFLVIFWLPILFMLYRTPGQEMVLKLVASDYFHTVVIFFPVLYGFNKLRYKLAIADKQVKEMTKSFLGTPLTKAIYEGGVEALANFAKQGIILAVDMRGYTNFMHKTDKKITREFMRKYHALVSQAVGSHEGYMHKSSGDGHIISFGVMDAPPELDDLPGYDAELKRSEEMRRAVHFLNALKTFVEMLMGFERLKSEYNVDLPLLIGAGVACGSIEIVVRGDKRYRQELDIDGETIVRAVRLESYSKYLNSHVDSDSSFLLISPELGSEIEGVPGVHSWSTTGEGYIRDYPWIEKVFYRQWKHNRKRSQSSEAA